MVVETEKKLRSMKDPVAVNMDEVLLQESGCEELLEVKIQCNLKWKSHIYALVSKFKLRLIGLEKLKHVMKKELKK